MVCVFVTAFMLTVTASAYIDTNYSIYGGKYRANSSAGGYIFIDEDYIKIVVYADSDKGCYVSGTSTDGHVLSPSQHPFYAYFNRVYECNINGAPTTKPYTWHNDYEATGALGTQGKNFIVSKQSNVIYIQS